MEQGSQGGCLTPFFIQYFAECQFASKLALTLGSLFTQISLAKDRKLCYSLGN
jgi:hypothetical protein